jgi:hypothetical protein
MSQDINQSILAALEAGYGHQDILDAFSKSSNPEHQSFYENYTQNMRDRAKEFDLLGTQATPGMGLMKRVRKYVEETPGEQLAAEGAGLAALGYAGKRAIQRGLPTPGEKALFEQNEISRQKLEFEREQAAKLDVAKLDKELAKQEFNQAKAVTEEVQQAATVADAQKRIEAFNNLQQQKAPVPAPQITASQVPIQGVQPPMGAPLVSAEQTAQGLLGKAGDEFRNAPKAPFVPPTMTEGLQLGESATKTLQDNLAVDIDKTDAENNIKTRVRRTQEQIAADKAALEASAPPGFRATYKKNKNEPIGPGAYNWLHNLKGEEEAIKFWEEAVGKKNVPYSEFVKNYNLASGENITGPVKSVTPSANAGTPKHVPNYIKGGATLGSLGGLAAMAALLGFGSTEKAQAAMAKAAGAIKDIGISPDIFAGKGEELGRLGQGYVSAGNPNYIRELSAQLSTERDPERKAILQNEIRKAGGVAPAMR